MSINLHIGREDEDILNLKESLELSEGTQQSSKEKIPGQSPHLIDLAALDLKKKKDAHQNVTVDLKEEIQFQHKEHGRICIVGEREIAKKGLGRLPMIAAALFTLVALNVGQIVFLGQQQGEEALALATEAFSELQIAGEAILTGEEGADSVLFVEAEQTLLELESEMSYLLGNESPWIEEPQMVQSLRGLLEAGKGVTSLGQHIAEIRSQILNLPDEGSLTETITQLSTEHIEPAHEDILNILTHLEEVDLSGTSYGDKIDSLKEQLIELEGAFGIWDQSKQAILTAMGDRYVQDYLVLLGNNGELRTGNGFYGSAAWIRLNDGRIEKMEFFDIYDYDNRLYEDIDIPVRELTEIVTPGKWRLRDSQTSLDFVSSAENALMFAELEELPVSFDAVVAINLSAAQSIVESLGPIQLEGFDEALTAANFPIVMSTLVEAKVDENSPKSVLGLFIEEVMTKMKAENGVAQLDMGLTLLAEAQKKQLMIYHTSEEVQSILESFGLTASMPQLGTVEGDFVATAFNNLGANKSDSYVYTDFDHKTHIFEDGSIVTALTIERQNTFSQDTLNWIKNTSASFGFNEWTPELEQIMGNDVNETGIRIYLPEGVQLLEVTGDALRNDLQFYYDPLQDLSYYYLKQDLNPGETKAVTLIYGLPWEFTSNDFEEYTFTHFKQPGLQNVSYSKTVTAPGDYMLSSYPLATTAQEGSDYIHEGPLTGDFEMVLMYR